MPPPEHITIGYPRTEYMALLEESARRNGFATRSLPRAWHRPNIVTLDKMRILYELLNANDVPPDNLILFTDAYDVAIIDNAATISKKFSWFRSDLVFNAESNFYPKENRQEAKQFFDKLPSKWRYLNSGCYIGYGWAIKLMIDSLVGDPERPLPDGHGADQALAQDFFVENFGNHAIRVALDTECRLFATLIGSERDYVLDGLNVRNQVTGNSASVLHANGDKRNLGIIKACQRLLEQEIPCDIRICGDADAPLAYTRVAERLSWHKGISEDTVFFLAQGNRRAVAITIADGILTFCPDGAVHCDQESILAWETLDIRGDIRSAHGLALRDYMASRSDVTPPLAPIPLAVFAGPYRDGLTDLVLRCYGAFR